MSLTLSAAVVTDPGLVREINEDTYHAGSRLLVVADGMGGLPAGEVASAIAVRALAPLEDGQRNLAALDALRLAVDAANANIGAAVAGDPALEGMGTTLTALLRSGHRLVLAQVGDSRAYLFREGRLMQLTRDDTYVQMLVDEGSITAAQARIHPHKSLVTQALQGQPYTPTFTIFKPRSGDRFMLCSDGLTDLVEDQLIERAMRDNADARECASALVRLALDAGGIDNVTVLIADATVE